jgi:Zn-dependent protease with chaperone function
MTISVYLPLLLGGLIAAAAPWVATRLSPAVAVRCLATVAAVCAATTTWALVLLTATLVRDTGPVIDYTQDTGIRLRELVPTLVALLALLALSVGLVRLVRLIVRRRVALRAVRGIAGEADTRLVVSQSATPYAFAIRDGPGRIVVSTGLLGMLDARERAAVLAHETAHLQYAHHRYQALVDLAEALSPMLGPLRTAMSFQLERWADEHAAAAVGDRHLVARTIARVALATKDTRADLPAGMVFGASTLSVRHRVMALDHLPPPTRRVIAMAALLPAIVLLAFAADATLAFLRWAWVLAPLA